MCNVGCKYSFRQDSVILACQKYFDPRKWGGAYFMNGPLSSRISVHILERLDSSAMVV